MSHKKIRVAVAGSTGFVGLDLVYLLSKHPDVKIQYLCAQKGINKNIHFFDKRIKKSLPRITDLKKINYDLIDVLFLSLPNGNAQKIIKKNINFMHVKFIDLSADFRLIDPKAYKYWYNKKHNAIELIKDSLYSVSEFTKKIIKKYRIIGNPGCYPTSIQLPLIPLLKKKIIKFNNIIIDSKSGYSGAGKNFKKKFKHKNLLDSVYAYATQKHRHTAEIDQQFRNVTKNKIDYTFNPHLLPTFRGILSSIYVEVRNKKKPNEIVNYLKKYHNSNVFVKILPLNSEIGTGNVIGTNNCEISICETGKKNKLVIFSAIDNLIKGAAGQAIQNLNLSNGLKENRGLK